MEEKNKKLEIVMKPINQITPYAHNPRDNAATALKLKKSIEEFGFKNPIILDSNDVIICGHARLKAAAMLGMEDVPCVYASGLTEDEIKAFRIADNKTAEIAGWDYDKLCDEMRDLMRAGYEMVLTGFSEAEQYIYLQDDMMPDKIDTDTLKEYQQEADDELLAATNILLVSESLEDQEFVKEMFGDASRPRRLYHGEDIRNALERRGASD